MTSIKAERMPFEFRKSVNYFKSYEQKAFSRQNRKYIFIDNIFLSSLRSNLNICRLNFENPSISSQNMRKKPFPVQTGSWVLATIFFCHHFCRTLSYTVWISKFCPIDLKLWAKNLFPKVIFDFSGQTGSRFQKPKVVCPNPGRTRIYAV